METLHNFIDEDDIHYDKAVKLPWINGNFLLNRLLVEQVEVPEEEVKPELGPGRYTMEK